jgi:HD-GYP domain-containing protein (c-di-GMP phosphodiesterase class II)
MTSDRPYRTAMSAETALCELKNNSGTQFDPAVVEAFVAVAAEVDRGPTALESA